MALVGLLLCAISLLARPAAFASYQPRLLTFTRTGTTVNFKVKAGYGMAYRVEKSFDLANWSVLSSYSYVNSASDLTNSFTDLNATNTKTFYRTRQVER